MEMTVEMETEVKSSQDWCIVLDALKVCNDL